MTNRVRYGKVDDSGIKTSVSKLFNQDGIELRVEFNTLANTFRVVTWPEGFTLVEGEAKSYQLVLRKVKLALADLGVGLTTESRNRDEATHITKGSILNDPELFPSNVAE